MEKFSLVDFISQKTFYFFFVMLIFLKFQL